MGTPPNITPQKRAAALRFARKALAGSEALHHEWLLVESQPLKAAFLKPVNDHYGYSSRCWTMQQQTTTRLRMTSAW
jgi:hypothetical protein